jgi:hypothetical protein
VIFPTSTRSRVNRLARVTRLYLVAAEPTELLDIPEGQALVKFGVSSDPGKRVRDIQVGCPFPIYLVRDWASTDAFSLEAVIRWTYRGHSVFGEWYMMRASWLERFEIITDIQTSVYEYATQEGRFRWGYGEGGRRLPEQVRKIGPKGAHG